jgi:hypothetical protein
MRKIKGLELGLFIKSNLTIRKLKKNVENQKKRMVKSMKR